MERSLRAVVFDFGGVLISPITEKIALLAHDRGTTMHELLTVLMGPKPSTPDHPWHRCERGEIAVADIQAHLAPFAEAAGIELRGDEIEALLDPTYTVLDQMIERVRVLRGHGIRTGLLTNTFAEFRPRMQQDIPFPLFDAIVESFAVAARKPERAIYEATAHRLGVDHHEIVYLDDFDQNLVPAIELGWTVVHVTSEGQALAALDRLFPAPGRSSQAVRGPRPRDLPNS